MCQFFLEGFCKYGDDCNFLHDPNENDSFYYDEHYDGYYDDYHHDYKDKKRRRKDDDEMEFHPPSGYEPSEKMLPENFIPSANKLSFVPNIDYYIPMYVWTLWF